MFAPSRTQKTISVVALSVAGLLSGCGSGGGDGRAAPSTRRSSHATAAPRPHGSVTSIAPTTTARHPTATTTPAPATTAAPAPTSAPTTTAAPAPGLPTERGDLAGGSLGLRTQAVQRALHDLRYDPGPADGRFGLKTSEALWAWQALHGLLRTGIVTPDMERLILARQPQAMLRPDLGPSHSEVDLTRQVLLVFRSGQPVLITHVSTGSGRHYCDNGSCGTAITPTGSFHYQRRVAGWRHAPLGLLYNPVYFNGGIAVHGEPSVPNYPASHGCVRIPMHIAEYFPSLVAKGDPIVVI